MLGVISWNFGVETENCGGRDERKPENFGPTLRAAVGLTHIFRSSVEALGSCFPLVKREHVAPVLLGGFASLQGSAFHMWRRLWSRTLAVACRRALVSWRVPHLTYAVVTQPTHRVERFFFVFLKGQFMAGRDVKFSHFLFTP